jgi:hypothetical protein
MREHGGKLGSQKHKWAELDHWRTLKESRFNLEWLFVEKLKIL